MKDKINGVQKLHKMVTRETENGDLKSFRRGVTLLGSVMIEETRVLSTIKELETGFNSWEYFGDGEFVAQTLGARGELGVDMKGKSPVYEMLPCRVRIDAENQDLYLDRKKVQCMCPESFARQVKTGQDKLMKASFSALTFASELTDVYDPALLKLKRQPEANIYLINLYKFLTPMGRFRRDYDQQSYAFDLTRFYGSGIKEIRNGRRVQSGPSREGNKAVRILNSQGREEHLSMICSFR